MTCGVTCLRANFLRSYWPLRTYTSTSPKPFSHTLKFFFVTIHGGTGPFLPLFSPCACRSLLSILPFSILLPSPSLSFSSLLSCLAVCWAVGTVPTLLYRDRCLTDIMCGGWVFLVVVAELVQQLCIVCCVLVEDRDSGGAFMAW